MNSAPITKEQVFEARCAANQTQKEAAAMLETGWRTWQDYETGVRPMPPLRYRLYRHLAGVEPIPFKKR